MIQHFAPLFTVAVNHSYYAGGCEDIEFFVPGATAGAMRGGKVLVRVIAGRLFALYAAESPGVPVNDMAGGTLHFGLRLTNSLFSNFTNPVLNDARQTPFYANGLSATALDAPQGIERASVSAELRSAGVWGLLAIKLHSAFYAAPPAFTLDFSPRQEQLKYFVVADNFTQPEFDQLDVTDNGFNEEGRPPLTFEKVLPVSFSATDISPALLSNGDSRLVMFRSQSPVARRERGFRKIQLSRNGEILIAHLPQPAADRAQAQFVIHLSKP
jgi:hypothetical protein